MYIAGLKYPVENETIDQFIKRRIQALKEIGVEVTESKVNEIINEADYYRWAGMFKGGIKNER